MALVGTTGAGKSTFVKLVARFYDPTGGRVLVDGTTCATRAAPFRRQLGYVPQEPFLFSGTIRSNIAYGRPDATDLEVERAARAVGAHDLVAALPERLPHAGRRDRPLTVGRTAPTAVPGPSPAGRSEHPDTRRGDLQPRPGHRGGGAAGDELPSSGRTTLLIAHRLQTARNSSRIVVVEEGGSSRTEPMTS